MQKLYGANVITPDGKRFISLVQDNSNNIHFLVHDIETILNSSEISNTYFTPIQDETISSTLNSSSHRSYYSFYDMFVNKTGSRIYKFIANSRNLTDITLFGLSNVEDSEDIIAVIYKNEYFSKIKPQTLSAGGPDVRAGKTFIGWMGYPETGTMEVE